MIPFFLLIIFPLASFGLFSICKTRCKISKENHSWLFSSSNDKGVYDSCSITVGGYTIISSEGESISQSNCSPSINKNLIKLVDIRSGWGNGAHPTTKLCLDFVASAINSGVCLLDYGTGSGILSILAAKLGASKCIAVDVDEDSLRAAKTNIDINSVDGVVEVIHTKSIYLGDDSFSESDITIANILPGALNRLGGTIWMLTKPGGLICLSGMRPHELAAIRTIYSPYVDLHTEQIEQSSHELYGNYCYLISIFLIATIIYCILEF